MSDSAAIAMVVAASALLLMPGMMDFGSPRLRIATTASASALASLFGVAMYTRRSGTPYRDIWLTVPGLFWAVSTISLGLASLAWMAETAPSVRTTPEAVVVALRVATIWIWATIIGFHWTAPRLRFESPLSKFTPMSERFRGAGTLAFITGLIAIGYLFTVGRFSFVSGIDAALSATSSIPQIAVSVAFGTTLGSIVVLWKGLTRNSHRLILLGGAMFALTAMIALIGGMKEPVLTTIFAFVATYRLARGRLPRGSIAVGSLLFVAVFAIINPYREAVRYDDQSISDALILAGSNLTEGGDVGGVIGDTVDRAFNRFRDIDSVAIIVDRTPGHIEHRDLTALPAETLAILVPRSIWPSKPPVSDGRDFAIEYLGFPPTTDVAIAVTLVGDAFRYGGLVLVVVAGMLLGAYLAVADRLIQPLTNPAALILFMAVAIDLAQSGNGLAVTFAGQLRTMGVTALMMMAVLSTRSASNQQQPARRSLT